MLTLATLLLKSIPIVKFNLELHKWGSNNKVMYREDELSMVKIAIYLDISN